MTQKQIILNKLQESKDWTPAWDLEKVSTKWGWIGTSGSRRARELAVEGKIDHKIEGGYAWYRAKEPQYTTYHVVGNDGKIEKTLNILKV